MDTQLSPLALQMLGILYAHTVLHNSTYLAGWYICDKLGVSRGDLNCSIPGTQYDEALRALLEAGLIEELPELHQRYRLKRQEG